LASKLLAWSELIRGLRPLSATDTVGSAAWGTDPARPPEM